MLFCDISISIAEHSEQYPIKFQIIFKHSLQFHQPFKDNTMCAIRDDGTVLPVPFSTKRVLYPHKTTKVNVIGTGLKYSEKKKQEMECKVIQYTLIGLRMRGDVIQPSMASVSRGPSRY